MLQFFEAYKNTKLSIVNTITDDKGKFTFDIEPGREYLLDSVVIYPLKADPEKNSQSGSDWASTTFLIPENNL